RSGLRTGARSRRPTTAIILEGFGESCHPGIAAPVALICSSPRAPGTGVQRLHQHGEFMPVDYINALTRNANGGTELMARALGSRLNPELLDHFQIIASRVRELDETRIRIFWAHDHPGDPASEHLQNGGFQQYERLVFVSNW